MTENLLKGKSVFDYLSLGKQEKMDFFIETGSVLSRVPSYWVKFENVQNNMNLYGPDLFTLDYLIGKNRNVMEQLFTKHPYLIRTIPRLLGIREKTLTDTGKKLGLSNQKYLKVQGVSEEYLLNFSVIDTHKLDKYFEFIYESGLDQILFKGISQSVHDYAVGVEAGMDSNGRKNRSGKNGEEFLDMILSDFVKERREWTFSGQIGWKKIKNLYQIELDKRLSNIKFDGSLYNNETKKLYLFEVNNFSSNGSKLKSSGGEFRLRSQIFEKVPHELIYITDGQGWSTDKSHLIEIIDTIGSVFNFKMLQSGYLIDYLTKVP